MTRLRLLVLALAVPAAFGPAMAQEASTVRIEPRPFYGATVTLEEGVRVFRPLPPHRQVIINPGSRTPLSLAIADERITSTNNNYNYSSDQPAVVPPGAIEDGFGFSDGFGRHHRRFRHHGRQFHRHHHHVPGTPH